MTQPMTQSATLKDTDQTGYQLVRNYWHSFLSDAVTTKADTPYCCTETETALCD